MYVDSQRIFLYIFKYDNMIFFTVCNRRRLRNNNVVVAGWNTLKLSTRRVSTYAVEAAGGRPGATGRGGSGGGSRVAGRGRTDNLTSQRQETPEKASQPEHNERRRATGGASQSIWRR